MGHRNAKNQLLLGIAENKTKKWPNVLYYVIFVYTMPSQCLIVAFSIISGSNDAIQIIAFANQSCKQKPKTKQRTISTKNQ